MRDQSTKCPVDGCEEPKLPSHKYCQSHVRYARQIRNQRYWDEGRCANAGCTRWPDEGFKTCQYHLEKQQAKDARRPRVSKSKEWDGVTCVHHSCFNPSAPGRKMCEQHLKYQSEYRKRNPEKYVLPTLSYNGRIRSEAINAYGGACADCGEDDAMVLQIDHINGRPEGRNKKGVSEMRVLRREGYPRDNIQLLCANCHIRKTYRQLGYRVALVSQEP